MNGWAILHGTQHTHGPAEGTWPIIPSEPLTRRSFTWLHLVEDRVVLSLLPRFRAHSYRPGLGLYPGIGQERRNQFLPAIQVVPIPHVPVEKMRLVLARVPEEVGRLRRLASGGQRQTGGRSKQSEKQTSALRSLRRENKHTGNSMNQLYVAVARGCCRCRVCASTRRIGVSRQGGRAHGRVACAFAVRLSKKFPLPTSRHDDAERTEGHRRIKKK